MMLCLCHEKHGSPCQLHLNASRPTNSKMFLRQPSGECFESWNEERLEMFESFLHDVPPSMK